MGRNGTQGKLQDVRLNCQAFRGELALPPAHHRENRGRFEWQTTTARRKCNALLAFGGVELCQPCAPHQRQLLRCGAQFVLLPA